MASSLKRDAVVLAGLLAAAALLAFLFRSGPSAPPMHEPQARREAPEIALPDLNGYPWSLQALRGRVVVENFWASWCSPCRAETPALVRLQNRYRERGLDVAGIVVDDKADAVRRFLRQFDVPYSVLMPPEGSAAVSSIESLPTTVLIDRQGRVARVYVGQLRERDLTADIERLLAEP
jgi:cytochrome c biogenesis protein CcmG/thiol:disulfide interchange protein DsbE